MKRTVPGASLRVVNLHGTHNLDVHVLDAPHVPHEETAIGGEGSRLVQHVLLRHVLPLAPAFGLELLDVLAVEGGHAPLHAEVARREDVQPLEAEARKHLDGPPAQPPDRDEPLHDLFVRGLHEHVGRQFPRRELLRQPLDVLGLPLGQTGEPQPCQVRRGDLCRRGELGGVFGALLVEQRDEFVLDGLGRRPRHLLAHDPARQRPKGVDLFRQTPGREDVARVLLYDGSQPGLDADQVGASLVEERVRRRRRPREPPGPGRCRVRGQVARVRDLLRTPWRHQRRVGHVWLDGPFWRRRGIVNIS